VRKFENCQLVTTKTTNRHQPVMETGLDLGSYLLGDASHPQIQGYTTRFGLELPCCPSASHPQMRCHTTRLPFDRSEITVPATPKSRVARRLSCNSPHAQANTLGRRKKLRLPGNMLEHFGGSCALASLLTMHLAVTEVATAHQRRFGTSAQI
jgi:hypothetical protein